MQKSIYLIPLFVVFLSGCGLPIFNKTETTSTRTASNNANGIPGGNTGGTNGNTPQPTIDPGLRVTVAKVQINENGWATFGQTFEKGSVRETVGIGDLPTQVDVVTRWPDSTIKFAILTARISNPGLYEIKTLRTAAAPSGSVVRNENANAAVNIVIDQGPTYRATIPASCANPDWLIGSIVSECRMRMRPVNVANSSDVHSFLEVIVDRRVYVDGNVVLDVTVENTSDIATAQRVSYSVNIVSNATILWTHGLLTHYYLTRWRKVIALPGTNIVEDLHPDFTPGINAKIIPRFSPTIPALSNKDLAGSQFDILEGGDISNSLRGDHDGVQRGFLPDWAAQYIINKSLNAKKYLLRMADLAGSWPLHIRDTDGDFISIVRHPAYWMDARESSHPKGEQDYSAGGRLSVHKEGLFSAAFFPFLLTGSRYYYDEAVFWANEHLIAGYHGTRLDNLGFLNQGVDADEFAWGVRDLADTISILKSNDPWRSYFETILNYNLGRLEDTTRGNLCASISGGCFVYMPEYPNRGKPFEASALVIMLERVKDHGLATRIPFQEDVAKMLALMYGSLPQDFPPQMGTTDNLYIGNYVNNSVVFYTTLAEVKTANQSQANGYCQMDAAPGRFCTGWVGLARAGVFIGKKILTSPQMSQAFEYVNSRAVASGYLQLKPGYAIVDP